MRIRERQRSFEAMQQTVANAQAQAEAMQSKLEEQQDVKAKLQEYW